MRRLRFVLTFLLFATLVVCAGQRPATLPQMTEEISMTEVREERVLKALYRQVNDAMVRKDVEVLEQLLQPDTLLVHMTGYQQPVSEWLAQIESEEMKYYSWQEEHIEVKQNDEEKAQLIGQSRVKARIWGMGPNTWRLQIQMFFEKIDGDWVIVKQVASTY